MRLFHPRALRWKIAALTAAACCAVAAVIGLLVQDANQDRLVDVGRQRAMAGLENMEKEVREREERPPNADLRPVDQVPEPLVRDLAEQARNGGRYGFWYQVDKPNMHWMWAAVVVDDGQVLIFRADMQVEERSLQLQNRSLATSVLAALAVVVPLAALATEPIVRRLGHGARTARAIADGDLDARIGRPGRARDEITEMSAAVDEMAAALQRRLENERRFTADVAHELRTPLMGLVTTAGLLPDDDEVAVLLRDRVRALNALVEDLLEISRLDAGVERAALDAVPLGELVTDVVRRLEAGPGVTVTVPAGDATRVETDPRRVERIVVNLVANAQRHGAEPVAISVTGDRVTVRDHGPGFPAALLEEGPQRFRTGASERGRGHGLGLTVAQGQAGVLGARLTFANAPDGGAVATLHL
ncbi:MULTISPECIES: sensor histidine kinase [Streptomyces]|uniref:histidine kinase n=1 Tax=Streptomyces tsukubensis (strain DSM 42081 / NBRC 108919 / NRRL 18488 / 9993) TaxID=1114943 RepID=I2NB21_STRT9|nr:HAMP domain-containing sensor histidine kinase [Streptomyces tsukubensis]MYS64467.1 HAMP domain-containing protein [Streptomyces sp. SID5473]AZK97964.1 two-component sensor histidine kinase [Streptomyces tsukubensis]EIF94218.1 two-component system sensor kinase [Streptomyces tsukubensis NRRL18488]QKM66112.1 sensor histidine kinase [Streptomyces tsukubensis NRRL18488]TAI42395.1 HAMP domain-containing histidine kinase [Streptomyces tsukubensis]